MHKVVALIVVTAAIGLLGGCSGGGTGGVPVEPASSPGEEAAFSNHRTAPARPTKRKSAAEAVPARLKSGKFKQRGLD
jgi:hypothetical protein